MLESGMKISVDSLDSLERSNHWMQDKAQSESDNYAPIMEQCEVEAAQHDSVFGKWDCNDNTPVLKPRVYPKDTKFHVNMDNYRKPLQSEHLDEQCNEAMESSTETASEASNQPPSHNGLFLPQEDNSNTEYYFDDEYALQYDANLAEVDMDMLDAVDLNTLLSPLAKRKVHTEEDRACYVPCVGPSKSDSCLYGLGSSGERGSSQDQSVYSEQDIVSSADLSDLPSEPLFSPVPGQEVTPSVSVDSLGRDTDISASVTTSLNDEKFSYDWLTNKDQYMLCPARCSSEDSFHDTVHGSTYSSIMGNSKENNEDRVTWREIAESKASSSNNSSNTTSILPENLGPKPSNDTNSVKEEKTTWKTVRRSSADSVTGEVGKTQSMPELGDHARVLNDKDKTENGDFIWGRTLIRAVSDGDAAGKSKEYAGTLVEMFQKLHQEQLDYDRENEALVTPPDSLPGVNSIWSVSTASSGKSANHRSPTSSPSHQGKVTWGSMRGKDNLQQEEFRTQSHSPERRIPIMCGSLLKENFVRKKVNDSLQSSLGFSQKDSSTQTSIHEQCNLMNRSMQTSVKGAKMLKFPKQMKDAETLISPDTERNMLRARNLQRKFREKLSDSLFYNKVSLPDLGFLKRQMSNSSNFPQKLQYANYANFRSDVMHYGPERGKSHASRRETSPCMSGLRGSYASRRSSESLSNNVSTCSSSSSGIDPGALDHSNKCRCRQFSPNLSDSVGSYDSLRRCGKNLTRPPRNISLDAKDKTDSASKDPEMMASHPKYNKHQIDAKQKCLEYLQLSPTRPPKGLVKQAPSYGYNSSTDIMYQLIQKEEDKTLKPCLRRNPALRERSMSDPFDLSSRKKQVIMRKKQDQHTCEVKKNNRRSWPLRAADSEVSHNPVYQNELIKVSDNTADNTAQKDGTEVLCKACEQSCTESDATVTADMESSDSSRSKKSVKFSEHVSYHSPYSSPHQSPKKQLSISVGEPLCVDTTQDSPPPGDFMVSPSNSPPPLPTGTAVDTVNFLQKKEIVKELMKAAELILHHFSASREAKEKAHLGGTATNAEIGQLILQQLCPALYTLLLDGLNPHVRSFFGKIRNTVWRLVEESAQQGQSTRVIHELVGDMKNLQFLTTDWLKFNAFVFGLLNHKLMDYWITGLHRNEGLLKKHYQPNSFLYLSNSLTKSLFLDLTTALQPLSQLPFQLEYNYEYKILQKRQDEQMSRYLLQKHVINAEQAMQEGQQILQQEELVSQINTNQALTPSTTRAVVVASHSTGDLFSFPGFAQATIKQTPAIKSASLEMLNKVSEKTVAVLSSPAVKQLQSKAVVMAGSAVRQASAYVRSASLPRTTKSLQNINTFADTFADSVDGAQVPRSASDEIHLNAKIHSTPIIQNGVFICSDFKESSDSDSEKNSSSDLDKNTYRVGVTNYQFDSKRAAPDTSTSTLESSMGSQPDIVDKYAASNNKPVEFRIPNRKALNDPQKRWSDPSMCSKFEPPPVSPTSVKLGDTKKRWSSFGSSFGPAVVRMFDKLLLPSAPANPGQILKEKHRDQKLSPLQIVKGPVKVLVPQKSDENLNASGTVEECISKQDQGNIVPAKRNVQALCHQLSTETGELSFEKGDLMSVVKDDGSDWLLCCHGEKMGVVHKHSVKFIDSNVPE